MIQIHHTPTLDKEPNKLGRNPYDYALSADIDIIYRLSVIIFS